MCSSRFVIFTCPRFHSEVMHLSPLSRNEGVARMQGWRRRNCGHPRAPIPAIHGINPGPGRYWQRHSTDARACRRPARRRDAALPCACLDRQPRCPRLRNISREIVPESRPSWRVISRCGRPLCSRRESGIFVMDQVMMADWHGDSTFVVNSDCLPSSGPTQSTHHQMIMRLNRCCTSHRYGGIDKRTLYVNIYIHT